MVQPVLALALAVLELVEEAGVQEEQERQLEP